MDASIMDGFTFKCGSVAAVSDIEHPITLAKYVMNNFPNSIFVGEGAKNLAKYANLNWLSEGNMIAPTARIALRSEEKGKSEINIDNQSLLDIDMLPSKLILNFIKSLTNFLIFIGKSTFVFIHETFIYR